MTDFVLPEIPFVLRTKLSVLGLTSSSAQQNQALAEDEDKQPGPPCSSSETTKRPIISIRCVVPRNDREPPILRMGGPPHRVGHTSHTYGSAARAAVTLPCASRSDDGGPVSLRPGRFDGGGMRYLRFTNWLTEIDQLAGPVAAIWFEEVRRHAGTDASHIYGGLMATLTAWAELRGMPYEGVPVGTIKRHATAKGNADKATMIAAIRARGFNPKDDNEADAIALLLWAIETKGGVR
jgi:hypothetical protein